MIEFKMNMKNTTFKEKDDWNNKVKCRGINQQTKDSLKQKEWSKKHGGDTNDESAL